MIQSFRALLIDSRSRLSAYCFPSSTRLLDHASWGNPGVNRIAAELIGNPHRVAWIGDLSRCRPALIGRELYHYVSLHSVPAMDINTTQSVNLWGLYFVNHTKRLYMDCTEYFCNTGGENGFGELWVLHPLPMLTAVGNGRGEDDYCGPNIEMIGSWAMDLVSISVFAPAEYEKVNYAFSDLKERSMFHDLDIEL